MRPPQAGFTYSALAIACAQATTRAPIWLAGTQGEVFPPGVRVVPGVEVLVPGVTAWQRTGPLPYPPPAIQAKVAATPESARNASSVTMTTPPMSTVKVLPELLSYLSLPTTAPADGARHLPPLLPPPRRLRLTALEASIMGRRAKRCTMPGMRKTR